MSTPKSISNTPRLFPNSFKKIGLAIIILAVISAVAVKFLLDEPNLETKALLKTFHFSFLNIGLFIFSMSKDKLEDERSMLRRMQAMLFTIGFAVLYLLFSPLVDLAFGNLITEMSANHLMLLLLLEYIIFYRIQMRTQS
ncbi:hypothetical protein FLAN108750_12355 [Flavobacterium antarcticum]|uniref:hypothetical protein n=1 Tax=Flavobacterium antarcticum TaxID=271155 RepID=UPI0003B4062E|nr:hypothetical protein [Flavobacterium antarcticum]